MNNLLFRKTRRGVIALLLAPYLLMQVQVALACAFLSTVDCGNATMPSYGLQMDTGTSTSDRIDCCAVEFQPQVSLADTVASASASHPFPPIFVAMLLGITWAVMVIQSQRQRERSRGILPVITHRSPPFLTTLRLRF